MIKMIKRFFNRRKMRAIAFGDIKTTWTDGYDNKTIVHYAVIFFENDLEERKWTVSGGDDIKTFNKTSYPTQCEIWKHTGLLPEWAKDPLAEKLCRD